jgi:cell division initiation protein
MKLTPLDIRHKEFKRGMRGYADVEVDEFLDEVADEYERLFKENIDLNERLEALEDKVKQYKRIEETLQKTLVSAQQSAEELKANASKESQLILRDAELKARQMVSDLYSDRQNLEKQIQGLRGVEQDLRMRLRTMLQTFLKQLEDAPPVAAEAPRTDDFAHRAQAIKEAIAREDTVIATPAAAPPAAVPPIEPAAAAPPAEPEPVAAAPAPAAADIVAEDDVTRVVIAEPETAEAPAAGADTKPGGDGGNGGQSAPERVVVGDDDLLADVDTGVNEDEFKW